MSLFKQAKPSKNQSGITLIEVIAVIMILAILGTSAVLAAPKYLIARRDAQRKADLASFKTAFESYVGDKSCYPATALLQTCGSTALVPYQNKVHCDPRTNQPYRYVRAADCRSYELYTLLENTNDDKITEVGCENGCGPGNAYNYGVVGGGAVLDR